MLERNKFTYQSKYIKANANQNINHVFGFVTKEDGISSS